MNGLREGSVFDKQVIDLPVTDTLRILASKVLKQSSDEVYDFAAADEKQINKLSNNNRVITPLAMQSPALVVNFYNKPFYNSKQLEELQPLATQIVELNLDNMPVTDGDIKTIAQFKNLRRLNLNFTAITGNTLQQLKDLSVLKKFIIIRNAGKTCTINNAYIIAQIKSCVFMEYRC